MTYKCGSWFFSTAVSHAPTRPTGILIWVQFWGTWATTFRCFQQNLWKHLTVLKSGFNANQLGSSTNYSLIHVLMDLALCQVHSPVGTPDSFHSVRNLKRLGLLQHYEFALLEWRSQAQLLKNPVIYIAISSTITTTQSGRQDCSLQRTHLHSGGVSVELLPRYLGEE